MTPTREDPGVERVVVVVEHERRVAIGPPPSPVDEEIDARNRVGRPHPRRHRRPLQRADQGGAVADRGHDAQRGGAALRAGAAARKCDREGDCGGCGVHSHDAAISVPALAFTTLAIRWNRHAEGA
jgi:hypothetical protein